MHLHRYSKPLPAISYWWLGFVYCELFFCKENKNIGHEKTFILKDSKFIYKKNVYVLTMSKLSSFLKMGQSGHLFQTDITIFTTNKCEKMSIQYTTFGTRVSPPISTRPGLPPKNQSINVTPNLVRINFCSVASTCLILLMFICKNYIITFIFWTWLQN